MGATAHIFYPGMNVGYGSVTEDYVDKIGEPKSLFWKARIFMEELPRDSKAAGRRTVTRRTCASCFRMARP